MNARREGRRGESVATVLSAALVGALAVLALRPWIAGVAADPAPMHSVGSFPAAAVTAASAPTSSSTTTSSNTTTSSSTTTTTTTSSSTTTTTIPAPVLVWADEFGGAAGAPPDATRWRFEIGGHGWGNSQLEYAGDTHARLDGEGHLVLTSEPVAAESGLVCWYGPCRFVSSRLTTEGLFARQYGRIEIRAALPRGEATWPAFWMLGVNRPQVGWPASGEIDVLEHVGRSGDEVHGALHGPGFSAGAAVVGGTVVDDVTSFHTYAVDWTASSIEWSVDGRPFFRVDRTQLPAWPFDQPFHLVLNLAIGGTLGGAPGDVDRQPHMFVIDHVRVYDLGRPS